MEEDTIVLYPSPGTGHLISMVELAKLILTRHPNSFSITILIISPSPNSDPNSFSQRISAGTTEYLSTASSVWPAISFLRLPEIDETPADYLSHPEFLFELARLNTPRVIEALEEISRKSCLKAFIVDFFCDDAFENVLSSSSSLDVSTYFYFTGGASGLANLLYLKNLHDETKESLGDMGDRFINVPGFPMDCLRASDVAPVYTSRSFQIQQRFMRLSVNLARCSGIAVNTFDLLERRALEAIISGEIRSPPVFAVGPVLNEGEKVEDKRCLRWLDEQAAAAVGDKSVVFLCFGSMGVFSSFQLRETAIALERSGVQFLWVVRDPPEESGGALSALPEGFMERTRERGLVVEQWAPQAQVLAHRAIGGFVTHCGWNSVLESVSAGVPMVAWPLYAEQKINAVILVKEMRVAVGPVIRDAATGLVTSTELERWLGELMGSETGQAVRETVQAMRDGAAAAVNAGGSSRVALAKLTDEWKQNRI